MTKIHYAVKNDLLLVIKSKLEFEVEAWLLIKRALPNIHGIVRCPTENESNDKNSRDLDGLGLSSSNQSTSADMGLEHSGPLVDDHCDGQVAPQHHHQGHQPRHHEHEHKVAKFLK